MSWVTWLCPPILTPFPGIRKCLPPVATASWSQAPHATPPPLSLLVLLKLPVHAATQQGLGTTVPLCAWSRERNVHHQENTNKFNIINCDHLWHQSDRVLPTYSFIPRGNRTIYIPRCHSFVSPIYFLWFGKDNEPHHFLEILCISRKEEEQTSCCFRGTNYLFLP